ncbi:MAG: hypothetical protein WAO58_01330 [Fimbriimonadaceae bacterium]
MKRLRGAPLLVLAIGCGGGGSAPIIPVPPFIVMESTRDGNSEIYLIDSVGLYVKRLTADSGTDRQPAFSHDNARILFVSNRFGDDNIFSINADGTGLTQLTTHPSDDNCPRFNFDGTKIVFQRGSGTLREIYVMDPDGSNPLQITNNAFNDNEPGWTPAGRIIFTSTRTGSRQLFIMDADGTNEQQLTTDPSAQAYQADFKADGAKIAFIRLMNGEARASIMDPDGSNIEDRGHGTQEFWPRWSPDGTRLVVTAVVSSNEDVYRMLPDGSEWTRLTSNGAVDGHGDW